MKIEIEKWVVHLISDDDGHLNIYAAHTDGSQAEEVDCGDIGAYGEIGFRVTTHNIEETYKKENAA